MFVAFYESIKTLVSRHFEPESLYQTFPKVRIKGQPFPKVMIKGQIFPKALVKSKSFVQRTVRYVPRIVRNGITGSRRVVSRIGLDRPVHWYGPHAIRERPDDT
jgi:hypothetical protein